MFVSFLTLLSIATASCIDVEDESSRVIHQRLQHMENRFSEMVEQTTEDRRQLQVMDRRVSTLEAQLQVALNENNRLQRENIELKNENSNLKRMKNETKQLVENIPIYANVQQSRSPEYSSTKKKPGEMSVENTPLQHKRADQSRLRVAPSSSNDVVAFSARLGHAITNLGNDQSIVMDVVLTNEGNGYNARTGVFTCSVPGTYVFSATLLIDANHLLSAVIVKNGGEISWVYAPTNDHWSSASTLVVVKLVETDTVWLRVNSGGHSSGVLIQYHESSFSGFLLRTMI